MKVVFVSTIERGGPATHLRTLAPSVRDQGVDVMVLCQTEAVAGLFDGSGIDVRVVPVTSKWDVAGARRMGALVRGADVVHAHDRRAALFALPLARLHKAATVYTYHGLLEDFAPLIDRTDDPTTWPIPRLRRLWVLYGMLAIEGGLGRLGAVVVPSRALAGFLDRQGFPSSRVHVLPYGIDIEDVVVRKRDVPFTVGTTAILIPRKDVALTLDACARALTPLHLEVFGDGPCRPALEAQARRLGLHATFHGFLPDVRGRLADLDVLVLSTKGDNLPVAILEAMAAGVPVVATRSGGIPELVADGETGLLTEAGDADGLAAAIDSLGSDESRRRALGAAGRERAVREFEAGAVARRMVELYGTLCASST